MPIYSSAQKLKSGVPLGGIGAGKLEIMPSGALDNFTLLSGAHRPLSSGDNGTEGDGVLGFHFGIFVRDRGKTTAKLLQTAPRLGVPCVEAIEYNGFFPFAFLKYRDPSLPVGVQLEAFSSFIRNDEKNSGLPAAFFNFKITNTLKRPLTVSLFAAARNLIGAWCVGRFNQVADSAEALSLYSYNKKTQNHDELSGEMCLSVLKSEGLATSYLGEWNMQSKHFVFDKTSFTLEPAWGSFASEGRLPDINTEKVVESESVQLGGALAAAFKLKEQARVNVTFILSWFSTAPGEGRAYETVFKDVAQVTAYSVQKKDELYRRTSAWTKDLKALGLAAWLKDALLNNLYPLLSSSMWTKKGRFGVFESPCVCPLLGTMDVRFYGSIPLALFFPRLELTEMTQFAEAQRPQGYIPHDLGWRRSDLASNSTNGLFWKDLNPKFILLAYRDFLLTQDEGFLKKLYPFIVKAFYWSANTDKNKDFLPDHEGADQTYDMWNFYGAGAYAGGIFLAALLALRRIALRLEDKKVSAEAETWFKQAGSSFEKKLWQRTYFIASNNTPDGLRQDKIPALVRAQKINLSCMVSQLAGQWIAHLLGLGYIVSKDKVKTALDTILKLNAQASVFGPVNGVLPSAGKDTANRQAQHIWFGMSYMLASLAIYEGRQEEGLDLVKKVWDTAAFKFFSPWDQPDMYSSDDGGPLFGDHYLRNMAVWSVFLALAKKHKDIEEFLKIPNTEKQKD